MRILLIVHGFPPQARGGTEIYTEELARCFSSRWDDEIFVLTRIGDPSRPEFEVVKEHRSFATVFTINNCFRASLSFEDNYRMPGLRRAATRLIDEISPAIAHIHHLTCLSTDLVADLSARRIPTVMTLHDFWMLCHRGQLLDTGLDQCDGPRAAACATCIGALAASSPALYRSGRFAPRFAKNLAQRVRRGVTPGAELSAQRRIDHMRDRLELVDLVLAPSTTVQQQFAKAGVTRIELTELGIDQTPFSDLKRPAYSGPLRVGFFGSLMVSKAPHLLLQAFATLPVGSALLEIFGEIVAYHGDASYRSKLEPLITRDGINHHGAISHAKVPRALSNLDVVVMPSLWLENSPLVIREAFLAGVPVIASNQGGMREMIRDGIDGLLFDPGSVADLNRCLQRLIDEPDLLTRLRRGILQVRTIEDDASTLRAHYHRLIDEKKARGEHPRIAAIVLNFRTPEDTVLAVRSLTSSQRSIDDIIVVDNGSGDHSVPYLRRHLGDVILIESAKNLGFSGGCNLGITNALERGAELIFLLNADAMITTDTIALLERSLDNQHPITGPITLQRSDPSHIATAGISFSKYSGRMFNRGFGECFALHSYREDKTIAALAGSAMLIRREVFTAIGLFDEDYFFSFEDVDFCLRARAVGFSSRLVGEAITYHAGSASIGPASPDRLYYATRNHLMLAKKAAPLPFPASIFRAKLIVMYNLAHGLRGPHRVRAVITVLKGAWHGLTGRAGPLKTRP